MNRLAALVLMAPATAIFNSCQNCDKIEDALVLADLAFRAADAIQGHVVSETPQESVWDVASYWTNVAEKVKTNTCCDETEPTTEYDVAVNLYFKEDENDPWGSPEKKDMVPKPKLVSCNGDQTDGEFSFTKNGVYLIEYLLDVLDETKERNEDNNADYFGKNEARKFEDNAHFGNNRAYFVIKVDNIDPALSAKKGAHNCIEIRRLN